MANSPVQIVLNTNDFIEALENQVVAQQEIFLQIMMSILLSINQVFKSSLVKYKACN